MANINLNTTSGLKFQQPNIPPGRTAMEGLVSGIGPTLQSIPSLMLQYQQLKQDRERAGLAHDVSVSELKRRIQDDAFTQAAQRVQRQIELLGLGRSQVSISSTGEKTEFPGLTGWEVILDENGLPSLRQRDGENSSPGVSRVIGSPGQSAINVTKSEFLKSPEKYREMGKLKIVDDTDAKSVVSKENKKLAVPGFELQGDVVPSDLEARQARDAVAQIESFEKGIVKLRNNVEKYGSTNLFGKGFSEARTLASDLQLTLKELAKLGVLSESDEKFLSQQIINPSSLKSLRLTTPDALIQLDTTLTRAKEKFNAGMSSKGYQPKGSQIKGGGGMVDGAPVYGGKIRITNGMETYEVDTSDLADAIAEGFQVVQ